MSTYLIFNQLRIIHPQFRPKSRSSVLEPSQNFLSSELDDRGTDHPGIFTRKHDRSCLEMFEADGVDSGAICKRGFIHLQFAEKPEAPEAERHLGSWILEIPVSPRISTCRKRFIVQGPRTMEGLRFLYGCLKNLSTSGVKGFLFSRKDRRTLAYVGWHRRWCSRARLSSKLALTHSTYSRECFRNARVSIRECGFNFGFRRLSQKHNRSCSSGDRSFRCWIVELCVSRFPNAETHGAAILAFGGLNSSGVEVAQLLCFLDSSMKSKVTVSPWVSKCSNLPAVGPESEVLVICRNFVGCKYSRANSCFLSGGSLGMGPWAWASVRVSFQYRKIELDFRTLILVGFRYIDVSDISSKGSVHNRSLDANTGRIGRTLTRVSAGTSVVFSGAIKSPTLAGPQMQQPPSGGTWVGSTYYIRDLSYIVQVLPGEWLHIPMYFQNQFLQMRYSFYYILIISITH
ncbi:LOW QUALITY PROTEIN: hypothetical protein V1477_008721 [Vespula maculifrons]|uniref:Uncharacterized protein n=1 Tax=Vespula maculifrons TaxID=7453 RepID=A0ABD2CDV2_VESMC